MPASKDLVGQRFGMLTVTERTNERKCKHVVWKCVCDCGTEVFVTTGSLRTGNTKSCGCWKKKISIGDKFGKLTVVGIGNKTKHMRTTYKCKCDCGRVSLKIGNDLISKKTTSCGHCKEVCIGDKFGRLTVVKKSGKKSGHTTFECMCDCGNTTLCSSYSLYSGNTKSCGCYKSDKARERQTKDILGMRFGKLIVMSKSMVNNHVIWLCKCDCGNTTMATTNSLIFNNKSSCGCIVSTGEAAIKRILTDANIAFSTQKKFKDCVLENLGCCKFDFFVNNKYIIEFDGVQHFKYRGSGWNTKENFVKIQQSDKIKNEYCTRNNIPIIRIPYTAKNLTINDLLPEKSKYLLGR